MFASKFTPGFPQNDKYSGRTTFDYSNSSFRNTSPLQQTVIGTGYRGCTWCSSIREVSSLEAFRGESFGIKCGDGLESPFPHDFENRRYRGFFPAKKRISDAQINAATNMLKDIEKILFENSDEQKLKKLSIDLSKNKNSKSRTNNYDEFIRYYNNVKNEYGYIEKKYDNYNTLLMKKRKFIYDLNSSIRDPFKEKYCKLQEELYNTLSDMKTQNKYDEKNVNKLNDEIEVFVQKWNKRKKNKEDFENESLGNASLSDEKKTEIFNFWNENPDGSYEMQSTYLSGDLIFRNNEGTPILEIRFLNS